MRPAPVGRDMNRGCDPGAAVSSVWAAVAVARMWIAAGHSLAAWGSYRDGWHATARAATAGRDAAAAGGEAVGKDGRMNDTARGNAVAALKKAVRAQRRARASFRRSAPHYEQSALWQVRAADAYDTAGDADSGRDARGQAVHARTMARSADGLAKRAARDEKAAREARRGWEAVVGCEEAAETRPPEGAIVLPADRAAWAGVQAGIHADAEYDRAKWQDTAEKADRAVLDAGHDLKLYAAATERAAAAVERLGRLPPEAEEGVAAWEKTMETAARVVDECWPGVRPGRRGAARRTA